MPFALLDNVTLSAYSGDKVVFINNITLSPESSNIAILNNVTLSSHGAILDNVTLSPESSYIAILNNVTLSRSPDTLPNLDYISFNYILTGSLADNLMEIYYEVVAGNSYGVVSDPESLRVNRLVGRSLFQVEFSDGSRIKSNEWYEFLYLFITNVSNGKRLVGNNDIERSMHLSKSLPSTFNPNWLLAATRID